MSNNLRYFIFLVAYLGQTPIEKRLSTALPISYKKQ
jgi:hypothetical protein